MEWKIGDLVKCNMQDCNCGYVGKITAINDRTVNTISEHGKTDGFRFVDIILVETPSQKLIKEWMTNED